MSAGFPAALGSSRGFLLMFKANNPAPFFKLLGLGLSLD